MGKSGVDSLVQDKEKIFYEKWGKPLRILLIVELSLKRSPSLLKEFALSLLRKRNRVFVISSQKKIEIEHTNCTIKYSLNPIMGPRAVLNIVDNLRHSLRKRYDFIFCSSEISSFLNKFAFIKNNYLIKKLDEE